MRGISVRQSGSHPGLKRRRRIGFAIATLASVSLLLTLFIGRSLTLRRLQQDVFSLREACSIAATDQAALFEALAHADDTSVIEEIARRELGLVYPGEEKVFFVEGQDNR